MIEGMEPATLNLDGEDNTHREGTSLKGKRVFIIEDDVFLGSMLSQRIATETNDVKLFKNGEEAITEMGKSIPDIVLLDILLPGIDGFEVLKRIRSNENTKNVPVLIVSNTSQLENREKAKALGAEFLLKALVTPHEIVDKIESMLESHA